MVPSETIPEFCKSEKLSKPKYYDMRKRGLGPREIRIGRTVRISPEAHADWRRAREQTTDKTD